MDSRTGAALPLIATAPASHAWTVLAAGSSGDVSTRHWLWGRIAFPARVLAGQLLVAHTTPRNLQVAVSVELDRGQRTALSLFTADLVPMGGSRFRADGELQFDGSVVPAELQIHDLGISPGGSSAEVRRFLTISAVLDAAALADRLWKHGRRGPSTQLFLHTVWHLPSNGVP